MDRAPALARSLASRPALIMTSKLFMLGEWLRGAVDASHLLGQATIIRRDADLLIVEFEAGYDGLELPDEVEVLLPREARGKAKVDFAESSPRGPHQKGVVVRLALRFDWETIWKSDPMLVLRWGGERSGVPIHVGLLVVVEETNPA